MINLKRKIVIIIDKLGTQKTIQTIIINEIFSVTHIS